MDISQPKQKKKKKKRKRKCLNKFSDHLNYDGY
jgi:hypothetical protein